MSSCSPVILLYCTHRLRCQYLYFCTSKASTFVLVKQVYLYADGHGARILFERLEYLVRWLSARRTTTRRDDVQVFYDFVRIDALCSPSMRMCMSVENILTSPIIANQQAMRDWEYTQTNMRIQTYAQERACMSVFA
jgi:hypothetical protein